VGCDERYKLALTRNKLGKPAFKETGAAQSVGLRLLLGSGALAQPFTFAITSKKNNL
jgi:hypothetical protein